MKNHRALLVVATPTSRTLGGLFDVSASRNRQQRVWELQLAQRCVTRMAIRACVFPCGRTACCNAGCRSVVPRQKRTNCVHAQGREWPLASLGCERASDRCQDAYG